MTFFVRASVLISCVAVLLATLVFSRAISMRRRARARMRSVQHELMLVEDAVEGIDRFPADEDQALALSEAAFEVSGAQGPDDLEAALRQVRQIANHLRALAAEQDDEVRG